MTTITLEVPDELAARLNSLGGKLPELLSRLLESPVLGKQPATSRVATSHPVYKELVDFLASHPTQEQISRFQISAAAQERLADLLDRNREGGLTEAETAELDLYQLVHNAVVLLKARAQVRQA